MTKSKRSASIERDTPIVLSAMAESVCQEAAVLLGMELDLGHYVDYLVKYANAVYEHNEDFRSKVKGKGNKGRDYLWSFMQHWLTAEILKNTRRDPRFRKIRMVLEESGFSMGHDTRRFRSR
jgi:hypothetical protein